MPWGCPGHTERAQVGVSAKSPPENLANSQYQLAGMYWGKLSGDSSLSCHLTVTTWETLSENCLAEPSYSWNHERWKNNWLLLLNNWSLLLLLLYLSFGMICYLEVDWNRVQEILKRCIEWIDVEKSGWGNIAFALALYEFWLVTLSFSCSKRPWRFWKPQSKSLYWYLAKRRLAETLPRAESMVGSSKMSSGKNLRVHSCHCDLLILGHARFQGSKNKHFPCMCIFLGGGSLGCHFYQIFKMPMSPKC